MVWNPNEYLKQLYESVQPTELFWSQTIEEWNVWRSRLRTRLVQLLGGYPSGIPKLQPVLLESVDCGTYVRQRIEIETYRRLYMPVYVLIPKTYNGDKGAVIALHGHGYGSKDIVGLNPDGTDKIGDPGYQKNFAVELVERGYLTVAPELLGFGERKLNEDAGSSNSCHRLSTFLLAIGQTMAGYRVFETLRCVDYLILRNDVNVQRIGCMGISGGGLVASFAAAIDDRISAAVISGFANTFQASILGMHHCVDNYVPGLSLIAEMPDLLALIAPKPMLIEAGTRDPIFPKHAATQAYEEIKNVYELLSANALLTFDLFEGDHEIGGHIAYDWFDRIWTLQEAADKSS